MSNTSTVVNTRTVAALRAHKTRQEMQLKGTRGKTRQEIKDRIADLESRIDAVLAGQPDPNPHVVKSTGESSRSVAALRAHKTRQEMLLPGTRGNVRKAIKSKIADLESRIADLVGPVDVAA